MTIHFKILQFELQARLIKLVNSYHLASAHSEGMLWVIMYCGVIIEPGPPDLLEKTGFYEGDSNKGHTAPKEEQITTHTRCISVSLPPSILP